uniref:Putative secreted protein n=1 Tax=Panstrongylus lignarius TaxID=156445 RepID=A0A224Y476_9HEMI
MELRPVHLLIFLQVVIHHFGFLGSKVIMLRHYILWRIKIKTKRNCCTFYHVKLVAPAILCSVILKTKIKKDNIN